MNTEEPRENEVFEITIERKETGKMCEDTIRFSKNCRKYLKRSRDLGNRYEFPIGSTIRLNDKALVIYEMGPSGSCLGCMLDGPELKDVGYFAASILCMNTCCGAMQRKDGRNTQYRLKEEVEEHGSL